MQFEAKIDLNRSGKFTKMSLTWVKPMPMVRDSAAKQVGAAHAGEHDAVFDLHLADLPRREQRLVTFLQNDSPLFRFCMRGSGSPLLVGIRAAHIFLLSV